MLSSLVYLSLGCGLWVLARQHPQAFRRNGDEFPKTVNLVFEDSQELSKTAGGGKGGSGAIDPELKRLKEEEEKPIAVDNLEQIPAELPREDRSMMGLVDPQLPVSPGGDGLDGGSGGGKGGGNGIGIGQGSGSGSMFRTGTGVGVALSARDVPRKYQEDPVYPKAAKKLRVEGIVVVRFTIDEQGVPIQVVLVSGHELLREETLRAAKNWRFEPVKFEGHPVQATFEVSFSFLIYKV